MKNPRVLGKTTKSPEFLGKNIQKSSDWKAKLCFPVCRAEGDKLEKKCIHDGHRSRLMNTVFEGGLLPLSDIQIAEILLFYVFPRGDVNPLAHKLIDHFGNIANIIDADYSDLVSIDGIGDRSAKAIIGLGHIVEKVLDYRADRYTELSNTDLICDFIEELLRFCTTERTYIIGVDHRYRIVGKKKLGSGSASTVSFDPLTITSFLSSRKPAGVFITHNHPSGDCLPSEADIKATEKLKNLFGSCSVTYIDHYIVGNEAIYSIERKSVVRVF